ncbi:MAG: glycosyltransferase, partial [Planctomycetota bacterium]
DVRGRWVRDVAESCKELGINFFISEHPRDKGVFPAEYRIVESDAFKIKEQLEWTSILVSRFSTVIYEALMMGRETVYYNPHAEPFRIFAHDDTGGIKIANNRSELVAGLESAIADLVRNKKNRREFLRQHCATLNHDAADRCARELRVIAQRHSSTSTSATVSRTEYNRQNVKEDYKISPSVSVIIPCFNTAKYLSQAIESVLRQTFGDFEIIVVDDGSTDNTPEVVKSFEDGRIHYIYQKNKGLAGARNTGIRHSSGRYITFLDADDYFLPNKLKDQVTFLQEHPQYGLVAGGFLRVDQAGNIHGTFNAQVGEVSPEELLVQNRFVIHSTLIGRTWVEKAGCFDESLRGAEEWDFHCRLAIAGCAMYRMGEAVCAYRFVLGSMSTDAELQTTSRLKVVDKVFSHKNLQPQFNKLEGPARGYTHLKGAVHYYSLNMIEEGRQHLAQGLRLYPQLRDNNYQKVVGLFTFWIEFLQLKSPTEYLDSVFNNLPAEAEDMHKLRIPVLKWAAEKYGAPQERSKSAGSSETDKASLEKVLAGSYAKLAQYKDKHRGQRCIIIGNGPSLNKMDLSFLKNEITFGMNRIYLLFDKWDFRPTYYVSVNPLVIEQSAEQICKIPSPKFLGLNGLPYIRNHQDTIFLQSIPRPSFSNDPRNGLWEGHTVTYVAMQLAYFMGFSEVILIGVDHYFKSQGPANKEVISDRDDQNHFHPHYFGKGVRWNLPDLAKSEVAYNLAKQTFEADDRRIVDATVDGHLTIFPKADYKQVFSPAPLTINNGELGLNAALIETEFGEYVRDKNENLSITVRPKSDPLVPAEPRREYLVSAIVSTYNSERFLRGCLDDLERQTIADNLEIIVVNSGSQENEEAIVREFQQRYDNIKYIKTEQRETLYTAWNRAIKAARGKFITTANTDDRHRKDAFEALSDALQEYPDVSLVYGDCYVSTKPNENYEENSKCCIYHYPEFLAVDAILFYQFGPQPMWRKNVHETIGYFDESYKAAGDHDFNIRFAMHFKALHIDEPLGLYLEHSEAISFKDNTMRQEQQRIVFDYRKPEIVEKLYRRVGIKADTAEEKAKVFLDMGVRAMEYYPPWKDGRAEHHLDFAFQCFNKAAEFKPDWAAAYNNLAVVLGLSGNLGGAEKLLEKAADMTQDSTISFNLKLISHPLPSIQFSSGAKLLLSGLSLPSQKEASLKRKLSEPLTQTLLSLPQGNVRSNLEYWQQLQDNQYFEKHQYYAGLKAYGTDCEKLGKYTSLSKEMTVVVIGCGYGRETLLIAPRVKHVYGIDVNRTILDKADKFLAERGITNFTSVLAQDWKHVVPSNIDVVYSIVVFQHLTRYLVKDYIHGLAKKLSPNGKFVCQFADLANGTHDAELRPYEPNTRWSQTEIEELIQECGLIQNAIDTQDIPGKGSWYWAFFGKQGARRPAAKILFYFDRIGNLNKISP